MPASYDAILIVAFGGPEGPDDVLPFLENVLRGKNVSRERMLAVAEHYGRFGGVSPLNAQVRALLHSLVGHLRAQGAASPATTLPVYWGNRNWYPMLADTLAQMADDGVRHALALVLSPYSSYSGCRQYLEDIQRAQCEAGGSAPRVDKIRAFYNHPLYIEATADRVAAALAKVAADRRRSIPIVYTAHSIPTAMAHGCRYESQLRAACGLVSAAVGNANWRLAFQSRSGPPRQPWLEPDVCEHLRRAHAEENLRDVVVAPIGFLSDHVEVLYDLDIEAQAVCDELGIRMVRAATVGNHPKLIEMFRLLIEERLTDQPTRLAVGDDGPSHDVCPSDCCPSGRSAAPAG